MVSMKSFHPGNAKIMDHSNMQSDITSFLDMQESVSPQVTAAISEVLSDKPYDAAQVPDWVDQITDKIIKTLCQKSESLKYIVSVIILEKKNGGFHLFSTCYWDQETDGTITIRWDNKAMHCVVSVFGIAVPS